MNVWMDTSLKLLKTDVPSLQTTVIIVFMQYAGEDSAIDRSIEANMNFYEF